MLTIGREPRLSKVLVLIGVIFAAPAAQAQTLGALPDAVLPASVSSAVYSFHFQSTVVDQAHSKIHALYTGPHSLNPSRESAASVTTTLFMAWRPLKNTSLYFDPELSGGQGLSGAQGLAGSPNGETYRVGSPKPVTKVARLYVQQIIGFDGGKESLSDAPHQLAGAVPENRLTLTAGKFSLVDWFDDNAYSHDPRAQFMNWALANSAAWDYPADTYGYTWGLSAEYRRPGWATRAAVVAEPFEANEVQIDERVGRAQGSVLEVEHASPWRDHPGIFRLLFYLNDARMGNYNDALAQAQATGVAPDVTLSRAYGRTKYGFTSSDDIVLADHLGGFVRLSWDDGRNETWANTEVDGSAALGLDWDAAYWKRPNDHWGIAEAVNVLSDAHRRYLAQGGLGFLLGDGALHYGPEFITETYYRFQVNDWLQASPDVQFVANPGYNRARGPVPIWGLRVHVQF